MLHRILFASALVAACAAPAFAQDTTANPATAAPKPVKVHKICRQDTATGSIMPRSICHTKDEWAQIDEQNGKNAEQFQRERFGSRAFNGNPNAGGN